MRNVKMKWVVAVCAVGLLLSVGSVASAIELSSGYMELLPQASGDVTVISFDYNSGPSGYASGSRAFRVEGWYDNEYDEAPAENQWMMPVKFYSRPGEDPYENDDWIQVDSDYGVYEYNMGPGAQAGTHNYKFTLNKYYGLFTLEIDGNQLDFIATADTTNPQPNGFVPVADQIVPNTFWADESYGTTDDEYGVEQPCNGPGITHAQELGWYPASNPGEDNPGWVCWLYGVGGVGHFHLNFDSRAGATVENISMELIPGDANMDYVVDDKDASIVGANWMGSGLDWADGDFNDDDVVNDKDAAILAAYWGQSVTLGLAEEGSPVPEPSTWCLLAGALAMLAIWRRKR